MEKLLTIKETMEILNVSKRTLQRWDNDGTLPSVRTAGGHRRYNEIDIENFKTRQKSGSQELCNFTNEELLSEIARRLKKCDENEQKVN